MAFIFSQSLIHHRAPNLTIINPSTNKQVYLSLLLFPRHSLVQCLRRLQLKHRPCLFVLRCPRCMPTSDRRFRLSSPPIWLFPSPCAPPGFLAFHIPVCPCLSLVHAFLVFRIRRHWNSSILADHTPAQFRRICQLTHFLTMFYQVFSKINLSSLTKAFRMRCPAHFVLIKL